MCENSMLGFFIPNENKNENFVVLNEIWAEREILKKHSNLFDEIDNEKS